MSARTDILAAPNDIKDLKSKGTTAQALADKLFANFTAYARANWLYAAQPGAQTAAGALAGSGPATLACGTIREALKIMLRDDLGAVVANEDINVYFLSRPGLNNFDSRVTGNVFDPKVGVKALASHFSTHYFVKCGTKWYDPCLTAEYFTREGPVHAYTKIVGVPPAETIGTLRKAGSGKTLMLFRLEPGKSVPGFGSVWQLVTPGELKVLLSKQDLAKARKDPDLKGLI